MYKIEDMDGTPFMRVTRLQRKYAAYWRDKSDWYWAYRLLLEFFELVGSLLGIHKDPIEWEILQIASICMNWLYKLENKK